MFRAMLWKELREQTAILTALLVLGTGVIATAATLGSTTGLDAGLGDFRAYTNAGRLAVLALTIASGVVIGASLFAGEVENETMDCLEMLPARRWKIWWSKLAAGTVLAVASGSILLAAGSSLGAFGSTARVAWVTVGAILMMVAFGWGTLGSTVSRNTLGACAGGLFGAVLFGVPLFVFVHAAMLSATGRLVGEPSQRWLQLEPIVSAYPVVLFPILLGGLIFTAPDRARLLWKPRNESPTALPRLAGGEAPARSRALVWLVGRQWRVPFVAGSVLALAAGLAALLEDAHLLVGWPLAACLAGVASGVFAWTDEQSKTTFKFWGERRLPLGVPWLAKIGSSAAVGLFWILLLFLPVFIRSLVGEQRGPRFVLAFGDGILGFEIGDILRYMLVWPLYGFAFGHLAGLLFRKTVVALGVGYLTAAPLAALWLPSLITGGVSHVLLWPVPLLVVLATRALLRAWTADRLATARPLATIGGVGVACIAVTAFGLGWRVFEVPVTAQIDDDLRFAEAVPFLDSDDGGRAFRSAVSSNFSRYLSNGGRSPTGRAEFDPASAIVSRDYLLQLAQDRWPDRALRDLGPWLASEPIERTVLELKVAAGRPLGPIENPRVLVVTTEFREVMEIGPAVAMLLARGLHWQQRGQPEEFVACLDAALAVTRNARSQQPSIVHRIGMGAEASIFDALELWINGVRERPELLERVTGILDRHARECPRDLTQAFLADRMIDRNSLNAIDQWAPKEIELRLGGRPGLDANTPAKRKAEIESELASFAVAVPWERERFRRILGVRNATERDAINQRRVNTWFGGYIVHGRVGRLDEPAMRSAASLRVAQVHLACARFARDRGRVVSDLSELVPKYLAAVPLDPYGGKPLRYRVSEGESIEDGTRPPVSDPAVLKWRVDVAAVPLEFELALHEPLAAAIGGLGYSDLPLMIAPGVGPDGVPMVSLDAVAAAAGGLVQWPLESIEDTDAGGERPGSGAIGTAGGSTDSGRMAFGMRGYDWSIRYRAVKNGQGIVWSLGPNGTDDGGRIRCQYRDQLREPGDLVRVVPNWGSK